jgi:hypothetical protein
MCVDKRGCRLTFKSFLVVSIFCRSWRVIWWFFGDCALVHIFPARRFIISMLKWCRSEGNREDASVGTAPLFFIFQPLPVSETYPFRLVSSNLTVIVHNDSDFIIFLIVHAWFACVDYVIFLSIRQLTEEIRCKTMDILSFQLACWLVAANV